MEKKFRRTIENFVCEKCGASINGSGYTDHCPQCLWSKHVDINPGDRKAECNGMMQPIGIENKKGNYYIFYKCKKCHFKHKVKNASDDNFDEIIRLSNQLS
ncbi:MAG: RNHCP domain-containing protein [Patescibacteria group bacterium]